MNFADELEAFIDAYHYRNSVDTEVPGAREMMAFAADALGLKCPPMVPTICINSDMANKTVGTSSPR